LEFPLDAGVALSVCHVDTNPLYYNNYVLSWQSPKAA